MQENTAERGSFPYNRISFFLNGKPTTMDIAPGLSSLDMINKSLGMYGTKCSCNEGDCGACTVVIAYPMDGNIVYEAINSCLYPAAKLHGKHLITVEGIGTPEALHPIQIAILEHHGSQCGYCTPGFVMSMFALFTMQDHPEKESILAALEGNLCRCTGYQSILNAALQISREFHKGEIVPTWCREIEPLLFDFQTEAVEITRDSASHFLIEHYQVVSSIAELTEALIQHPHARLIAGGTDIMVQVNIGRQHFEHLVDISGIKELQSISYRQDGIHIGAAVTYSQVMESGIVKADLKPMCEIIRLIASRQIRNFGTLIGNVANASPIGDSLPLLMAYDAKLVLKSQEAERTIPIREFFIGYRQTLLKKGEFIQEVIIPLPNRNSYIKAKKTAKRKSVDISAISSAIRLDFDGLTISNAVLAFGGVAATPILSTVFPLQVIGKSVAELNLTELAKAVSQEFSPLSDVRGSSEYRSQMIQNHIIQYLEEYNG